MLDTLRPHATLSHLRDRIKVCKVNADLDVTLLDYSSPGFQNQSRGAETGMHGLVGVLLAAHAPYVLNGSVHVSMAPAATYIALDHGAFREGEGERLRRGIEWLMERRDVWNLRIVLTTGWNTIESSGWIENTRCKPVVQALHTACDAGLLVVSANGNTKFDNELPPVEFFSIGGYDDSPMEDMPRRYPYPDQPWGRNGDGHLRPDILAPMLSLVVPFCEEEAHDSFSGLNRPIGTGSSSIVTYGGQTSGAAALITGICAHILSRFPDLTPSELRKVLVQFGDEIPGYENPAPAVNVAAAVDALETNRFRQDRTEPIGPIIVEEPDVSLYSDDPIERSVALTMLAREQKCTRGELWNHTLDNSPTVRKVAIWALGKPVDDLERCKYWVQLNTERDCGVRGYWAYGLLQVAARDEVGSWISFADDDNWSVRWCVSEYLKKYDEYPNLERTFDLTLAKKRAQSLRQWYSSYCRESE